MRLSLWEHRWRKSPAQAVITMPYRNILMGDLPLLRNLGLKPRGGGGASQFSSGDQTSKRYFFLSVLHISYVLVWGSGSMSFLPALAVLTTTIRRKSLDVYEPMYIYPQTIKIRLRPNRPTARPFLSIWVRHVFGSCWSHFGILRLWNISS